MHHDQQHRPYSLLTAMVARQGKALVPVPEGEGSPAGEASLFLHSAA